ncbi:MAG TPA: secretin N-terminal domain-containing protein [Candidatus Babeliales bacterium]|jgi:general secretion pathway protein D|nr:secretin N-terminal domain-containing protein [Candidatus Babeliales bacterium]
MNKYSLHFCFVFILATAVCMTETGSRKRYRNKKQSTKKNINTHMNVEAYQHQVNNKTTPQITAQTTGMPQMQHKIEKAGIEKTKAEYTNPIVEPQVPATEIKIAKTVEMPTSSNVDEEEDSIELNFENADLQNFVKQIEDIFEITFITDDALTPLPQGKKPIKNNKISFKTNQALSKREAWNLFVTFLDIAGFALVPQADPKMFRIASIEAARKSPLPTFIGVDPSTLPDTDELIRYVYFLENAPTSTIMEIVGPLRSSSSQGLVELKEHKGFILTDKSYNIKMLMLIVKELDKVSIPESMSILKLRNANAEEVEKLYKELLPKEEQTSRFFTKKQPTSLYFPENTRIISDPRTNTLILLGPSNAIKKIEEFIVKYIDIELDQAYSPLYSYQLKYADANTIAEIMSKVTAFGRGTPAGDNGGVRGGDQYMRPMTFIAEPSTNRVIIKGHYEDYLKAQKVIAQLDEKQPQVAIEVLVLTVNLTDTKSLGSQLRSKQPGPNGLLGNNIKFQTSGLYGTSSVVTNPNPSTGAQRLLGNLINLVTGATAGTSLLTLGTDVNGVWGICQALQSVTDTEVVANPFILATNNAKARVYIGEQRRIATALVVGTTNQSAFDADDATLNVEITPQISSDGMISLDIVIDDNEFTDSTDQTDATQNIRKIKTNAIVANKEVLALGGLIQNTVTNTESKVPILGDIPILGWFFKNKKKQIIKQSLLVLISTRIIESHKGEEMQAFTRDHIEDYQSTIDAMEYASSDRDPIHRAFFQDKAARAQNTVEGLIFERHQKKQAAKIIEQKKEVESANMPSETNAPQEVKMSKDDNSQMTHNSLIKTMQNKKRTQLSLAEFLHDKEAHT